MRPLVIYHGHCMDGFTAAWVVHRFFGGECELFEAHYYDAPPDVRDRDVVIVDFAYPRDVLIEMHAKASSLLVLDHHKTAEAELEGLPYARFDLNRSGAGIAWDHFFPDAERPWLVDYVEDRDLWRFALPDSRAINAYLRSQDPTLAAWDALAEIQGGLDNSAPLKRVVAMGGAILAHIDQAVKRNAERAGRAELGGWVVPIVNASPELASELGNLLALDVPFAVIWSQGEDGRFHYSLRSHTQNPGAVDVAKVARSLGGGGHRHAAGFATSEVSHRLVR